MSIHPLYGTALAIASFASLCDARDRRVASWITAGPLPLAPIAWALYARGAPAIFRVPGPLLAALASVLGAILCGLVPLLLFRFSLIGGADVKVLATVGALLLPRAGLLAEMSAFSLAAILLPVQIVYRGRLFATVAGTVRMAVNRVRGLEGRAPRAPRAALPAEMSARVRFTPFVLAGVLVASLAAGGIAP
jgi:prepilin peptidase CpaA